MGQICRQWENWSPLGVFRVVWIDLLGQLQKNQNFYFFFPSKISFAVCPVLSHSFIHAYPHLCTYHQDSFIRSEHCALTSSDCLILLPVCCCIMLCVVSVMKEPLCQCRRFVRRASCLPLRLWSTRDSPEWSVRGFLSLFPCDPITPTLEGNSGACIVFQLLGWVILMVREPSLRNTEVDVLGTTSPMPLVSFHSLLEKLLASGLRQCPPVRAGASASSCWDCWRPTWVRWAHLPSRTWFLKASWGVWRAASPRGTQPPQEIELHKSLSASSAVYTGRPWNGQFRLLYLEKTTKGPANKQSSMCLNSPLCCLKADNIAFQWSLYRDCNQIFNKILCANKILA